MEQQDKKIHVWVDADPGIDDAISLAVIAANQNRLAVEGMSAVAGNQTIEKTVQNLLTLGDLFGMPDVKAYAGAKAPLVKEPCTQEDHHGTSGLGYFVIAPSDRKPEAEDGIESIMHSLMALPEGEKMVILATGPLTNIALLLQRYPQAKEKIDRLIFMGGSSVGGNMNGKAEFNIWADPEAARIVCQSGLNMVMCPLDLTWSCGLNPEQIQNLCQSDSYISQGCGQMLHFYLDSPSFAGKNLVSIHDACTSLYLLYPDLFQGEYVQVSVHCDEDETRGETICTPCPAQDEHAILKLNQTDLQQFQKTLLEQIAALG